MLLSLPSQLLLFVKLTALLPLLIGPNLITTKGCGISVPGSHNLKATFRLGIAVKVRIKAYWIRNSSSIPNLTRALYQRQETATWHPSDEEIHPGRSRSAHPRSAFPRPFPRLPRRAFGHSRTTCQLRSLQHSITHRILSQRFSRNSHCSVSSSLFS